MAAVATETPVIIPSDEVELEGTLSVPEGAHGIVLFAHGSGSSRLSPRNTFVARELQKAGLGTLLFDLLTEFEDQVFERRFQIDLLTRRLVAATHWVQEHPHTRSLVVGYFGASTGAAAALAAAAELGAVIRAVVSRGGRPDLAEPVLKDVISPTLLIVGGHDELVIELNEMARDKLRCTKRMDIVPGATHLFEEPGTLEQVARLATGWFRTYLTDSPPA